MLKKRIIPCLDIAHGQTVKGINFEALRNMGDPVELASYYDQSGADELVLLDILATNENKNTTLNIVQNVAECISIPFTIGGGIRCMDDVSRLLDAGADKVSINSAAINNPKLITEIANRYGSQCVVVAIDTLQEGLNDIVKSHGGKKATKRNTIDWAREVMERGAGEILLTSINNDGVKQGFAHSIIKKVMAVINIPIIASGGAGNIQHFIDLFQETNASAGLAASIFHSKSVDILDLKQNLKAQNIAVR